MQTFYLFASIVGTLIAIILLIRKAETKTVLIGVGFILCLISLKPIDALNAFTTAMTKASLLKAICASMGFAFVMKFTKCDVHLVRLLTAPLKNLGFFLIPIAFIITFFISIAIPSAAGCAAAVGATLIPLLMASGIKPAMAATAVVSGTLGGVLSPGTSHNSIVANMSGFSVPQVIGVQLNNAIVAGIIVCISLMIMALIFKDYTKGIVYKAKTQDNNETMIQKVNVLYALMPLVPIIILVIGASDLPKYQFLSPFLEWTTKIGVAEAMLLGAILAIIVTMSKPSEICKEFFSGMGSSYANVVGIIIAASVFVAGLKACGAIDAVIEFLKNEQHYVSIGGTFIPFLMAIVTGSGDAPTIAFNESITIHAAALGFDQVELGTAVTIAGVLGRVMSPILAANIIVAAIAGTNTIEIVKRTALGSIVSLFVIAFIML
ncbi:C4-dicarboxylate ABC transporter [Campylobacter novaezeelandiae]|uniref:C4-dicarboxylate ABC transporter n=1 Tax=Campylobacter novaezeelandiae TaxID=2267891 RepID=A0A4V2JQM3_9BACT|nr:C4-dicarboxylate transporter DcuC [Campylobacter novaezeelandiae]MBK1963450.1 C4-dicarboxylate transporter DcuC [Campylobacter novaezeelandiae]MBK1993695.1 C4-dicarboxylate transporter DcuC [Campylobacter novaezeelandiae]QWU80672.1 C4-dicarboxylate transporter, DcuC family [Campylobacter novaezeelandiae]TBR78469.1 C4-dicarboxylate ABC transporter [Campylobacter novaezeelandiae]TBR78778.1 C4-dicarboxylate ABC transporter [Campylobacter novaezeelandiae]